MISYVEEVISSDEDYLEDRSSLASQPTPQIEWDNREVAIISKDFYNNMQLARRSPSPYSAYRADYEAFSEEMKSMKRDNRNRYTYLRKNNESHPEYKQQWNRFWVMHENEAIMRGEAPNYDAVLKEFVQHWTRMLTNFEKQEYQKRKSEIMRKYRYDRSPSRMMTKNEFYEKRYKNESRRKEHSSRRERSTSPRGRGRRSRSSDERYSSKERSLSRRRRRSSSTEDRRRSRSQRSPPRERSNSGRRHLSKGSPKRRRHRSEERKKMKKKKNKNRNSSKHVDKEKSVENVDLVDDNIIKVLDSLARLPTRQYPIVPQCKSLLLQAYDMEKKKFGSADSLLERSSVQQLLLVAKDKLSFQVLFGDVSESVMTKQEKIHAKTTAKRVSRLLDNVTVVEGEEVIHRVNVTQLARATMHMSEINFARRMARITRRKSVRKKYMTKLFNHIMEEQENIYNKLQEISVES